MISVAYGEGSWPALRRAATRSDNRGWPGGTIVTGAGGRRGTSVAIDPGLRRLALSTLLPAFPGHEAPGWTTDLIDEGLAGCIIFGYNIVDPGQLTALPAQPLLVPCHLLLSRA